MHGSHDNGLVPLRESIVYCTHRLFTRAKQEAVVGEGGRLEKAMHSLLFQAE